MVLMFEFLSLFLFSILTAIFIGLYFYFTRNFKFWQKLGIPYVKPTPFVGSFKECVLLKTTIGEQLQRIYNEHSDKPYVGIFSIDKPSLLIRDAELVKNILVKDSQNFIDHVVTVNEELEPVFSRGLFLLKGQIWRQVRTSLTPVFTSGKMKMMFHLVHICGKELADYLENAIAEGSPVDVKETMARYTTDVIASCAFGINTNTLKDPDAEFRKHLKKVFEFSVRSGLAVTASFLAPYLSTVFNLKIVNDVTINYVRNVLWSTVEYRERHGVVRNDLLDSLMELRRRGMKSVQENTHSVENKKASSVEIDGDLFVGQAFFFIIAGYETSGTTLCYVLFELALHPDIQHRLRAEIMGVMNKHNGQLTYDGIQQMAYLDRVISETLRKYPVLALLDRKCCSDYELPAPNGNGTITLPAGTDVFIPVLALHRDPTYFPEPEKFDPDRFTEENKLSRPKYTYLPFGEGPRMCIGMRFGLMQVKTGLCHILSRFEVAPCKETPERIVFDTKCIILITEGKLPLSFTVLK